VEEPQWRVAVAECLGGERVGAAYGPGTGPRGVDSVVLGECLVWYAVSLSVN
jgi:hypothetical protein